MGGDKSLETGAAEEREAEGEEVVWATFYEET